MKFPASGCSLTSLAFQVCCRVKSRASACCFDTTDVPSQGPVQRACGETPGELAFSGKWAQGTRGSEDRLGPQQSGPQVLQELGGGIIAIF